MLRVASVPSSHVYVQHLARIDDHNEDVSRLPDPVPADGRTAPGKWWPPAMLEPQWIAHNHTRFDVFHVHFGFDAIAPETLEQVVHELDVRNIPLVYTVHDLRNPHHPEPAAHVAQQSVLVEAATALITLTPGAADRISDQWNRTATVLPHPHVANSRAIDAPRQRSEHFVIGIHAKSLRANMDPLPVIETLAHTVRDLPGARLQINVHNEVFEPTSAWYAPEFGRQIVALNEQSSVDVRVHDYMSDDELNDYLRSLTVSVLPYRFGTHSGWLEACHDLGTAVIAPSCGFYDQQRPCDIFRFDENGFDPATLHTAVEKLYARWSRSEATPRATWSERKAERTGLADAHLDLYEAAMA